MSLVLALAVLPACQSAPSTPSGAAPPLFRGLGHHHRAVGTSSPEAQRYFDQGLTFAYAFNHDEAIRSFQQATTLDPGCAMAWWGVALCHGPHINNPAMDETHSRALAWKASPRERALVGALAARYAWPAPADRSSLDRAYAEAMKFTHAQFPDDTDIATLYAESLMDLRPWDLWALDGTPRPETPEIVATLERVLAKAPDHPGANHLYIHAVEASRQPERAVPSATRLRTLVPAAGHLVHMPAHIDARVGRWDLACSDNRAAIAADSAYRKLVPHQGFYHVYMAHNHQFLAFACMMSGRSKEAIGSARQMVAAIPQEFVDQAGPLIDGILPLPLAALMRFGRWEEILAEPRPAESLPISTAMWHFTPGVALANTDRLAEAELEREELSRASAAVPADGHVGNSPAPSVVKIAGLVLDGEIAYKSARIDEALALLREAVAVEDTLRYDEPPDWLQPVRHTLGAVLLEAGRTDEAEQVYREDLNRWPGNGWSLYGLAQCLKAENDPGAGAAEEAFKQAWKDADTLIASTCLCVTPAK
jgi:tetratricopeptide (TPR) repeat protein